MGKDRESAEKQTSQTNSANYAIAQMNNQYNQRMLEKQIAYNYDIWNKENAYNTPAAQRARYEEAGINPNLVLSNLSSGTASSIQGIDPKAASEVNRAENPAMATQAERANTLQGLNNAAQNLVSTAAQISNSQKQFAETKQVNIENQYRAQQLMKNLEGTGLKNKNMALENDYLNQSMEDRVRFNTLRNMSTSAQADLLTSQAFGQSILNGLSQKQLENYDERFAADMGLIFAKTVASKASAKQSLASAYEAYSSAALNYAKQHNIELDNDMIKQTWDNSIETAKLQPQLLQGQISLNKLDQEGKSLDNYSTKKGSWTTKFVGTDLFKWLNGHDVDW